MMIHHYEFLSSRFSARQVDELLGEGVTLWRNANPESALQINLVFSHPTDNEGELTLELKAAGVLLFVCSFTFVPGFLVHVPDETIVAITRLQGVKREFERTRLALKSVQGLSPAMLCMSALKGIADRRGLRTIAGVSADAQVCRFTSPTANLNAAYDELFISLGAVQISNVFYKIALPYEEKPLSEIKSNNRARTKRQRELKSQIADESRDALAS